MSSFVGASVTYRSLNDNNVLKRPHAFQYSKENSQLHCIGRRVALGGCALLLLNSPGPSKGTDDVSAPSPSYIDTGGLYDGASGVPEAVETVKQAYDSYAGGFGWHNWCARLPFVKVKTLELKDSLLPFAT
jgi:hypothetical protein